MEAFGHLFEHVDDADQLRGDELLEAARVLVGYAAGQLLVVDIPDLASETLPKDEVNALGVAPEVGQVAGHGVVEALREEATSHPVEVYQERVGVIERVLGNPDRESVPGGGYRDVVGDMVVGQGEAGEFKSRIVVDREGFQGFDQAVGVFLGPGLAVVGEDDMVGVFEDSGRGNVGGDDFLAEEFDFDGSVDVGGGRVSGGAVILLPGEVPFVGVGRLFCQGYSQRFARNDGAVGVHYHRERLGDVVAGDFRLHAVAPLGNVGEQVFAVGGDVDCRQVA